MKYWGYMPNDFINGQGISVSLWVSGCPFHCIGCHNKKSWNPESGFDVPTNIKGRLVKAISDNGIERNFSILGGEPLAHYNRGFIRDIITAVRAAYPNIKIFLWTGYTLKELQELHDEDLSYILSNINYLIDGRYEEDKRDISLKWRGSSNQNIYKLTLNKKYVKINYDKNGKEVEMNE